MLTAPEFDALVAAGRKDQRARDRRLARRGCPPLADLDRDTLALTIAVLLHDAMHRQDWTRVAACYAVFRTIGDALAVHA